MNILECKNLTKKYEDFTAVDGVDFSIGEGEVFGLLGPNGAGKPTTINLLIGLAKITSGSVIMARLDYSRGVKKAHHLIAIVPDESKQY